MAEDLEGKVNEDQEESPLETAVKEKGFLRNAFDLLYLGGAAAATTALSTASLGSSLGVLVGAAFGGCGFIGSLVKKTKSFYNAFADSLKTYSSVNAVIYPMIQLGDITFPIFGKLGASIGGSFGSFLAKSAYSVTAYVSVFNVLFRGAYHLFDRYLNPKGMIGSIKDNFGRLNRRIAIGFSPALIAAANGLTGFPVNGVEVPYFAVNALPVSYYHATHPFAKEEKTATEYQPS